MFDDLLTSSRGPGVLGLLLGILVLVGFGALTSVVLDSDAYDLEKEITENKATLEFLQDKETRLTETTALHSARRKIADQLNSTKSQLESNLAKISTLEPEVANQSKQLSALNQKFEAYQNRYILSIRTQATGEKIPTITIKNGKTYDDVIIRRVFSEGMDIRHRNGGTLITLELMPDELLERFHFSKKDEARNKEMDALRTARADKGEKAYNKSIKVNSLKTERKQLQFRVKQMTKAIADAEKAIISNKASEEKARKRAKEYQAKLRNAKARGRSSSHGAQIKKEEAKIAEYKRSRSKLNKLIKSNNREIDLINREIKEFDKRILDMQASQE